MSVSEVKLKSPRRRDRAVTESLILNAAERLFATHGFDAVGTKLIAKEAGVTIGAVYHHFASKEALYAAAAHQAFERGAVAPADIFLNDDAPEHKLCKLAEWFVRSIISDESFGLLLQRELLDPRWKGENLLAVSAFRDALKLFKEILRHMVPDANVDEAVATMLALCFGFTALKGIYEIVPGAREALSSPEEIATHATRLLLVGLRA